MRVYSQLITADKLMMERPDSSLMIIVQIDTGVLYVKREKAKYSLLHTMAIDRNGNDTTDLSLISDAVKYYQKQGNNIDRARTFYYHGRILYNKGDYTSSLISFRKALSFAKKTDDNWIKGMIYSLMGSIYNQYLNTEDELQSEKTALHYFMLYGDSTYINNALYRLARAYHNNREFEKADSLYSVAGKVKEYAAVSLLERAINELTRESANPQLSVALFEKARSDGAAFTLTDWYQYTYALLLNGDDKTADRYYNQLKHYPDDARTLWWKYSIAKAKGQYPDALSIFEKYSWKRDSIMSARVAQSLYRAESDYYASEAQEANRRISTLRTTLIFSLSIIGLCMIILIIVWQGKRMKDKAERLDLENKLSQMEELIEMTKQSDAERSIKEEHLKDLRLSFVNMYRQQFAKMGALYNTNLDISFNLEERLKEQVKAIMEELSAGETQQARFEKRIDRDFDNIMTKLRSDFPKFDESSFRLLSYVIAGFKDSSIAVILNDNYSSVRTRKSRLKHTILEASTPNKPLYEIFLR